MFKMSNSDETVYTATPEKIKRRKAILRTGFNSELFMITSF